MNCRIVQFCNLRSTPALWPYPAFARRALFPIGAANADDIMRFAIALSQGMVLKVDNSLDERPKRE